VPLLPPPSSGAVMSSREITVLPSNEISTTTADAALAAETFADMIRLDDDNNDGDLYSSSCPLIIMWCHTINQSWMEVVSYIVRIVL